MTTNNILYIYLKSLLDHMFQDCLQTDWTVTLARVGRFQIPQREGFAIVVKMIGYDASPKFHF
jgi:hypothetical protein